MNTTSCVKTIDIKRTMSYEDKSFKEAELIVNNPTYITITTTDFALLNNVNNFPTLSNSARKNSSNFLADPLQCNRRTSKI